MRHRKWWLTIACVAAVLGVAALSVASVLHWQVLQHLPQSAEERWRWVERASWLAGIGSLLVAVLTLLVTIIATRQARPAAADRMAIPVDPHLAREAEARDRLRAFLGRRRSLPRMGDPSTRPLALRVHPAIPLPSPGSDSALSHPPEASVARASGFQSWRRWVRRAVPEADRPSLDPELPKFVERDKSAELWGALRKAGEAGGFLILVGDSSVGKTRLLYELAREVLPDFVVLAPDLGHGGLVNSIAQATFQLPRMIVWLDELQRFLEGPYLTPGSTPITAVALRHLLDSPTPVVILGTIWPERAWLLRSGESDQETGGHRTRYPGAADVLNDGRLLEVSLAGFSPVEREKAKQLATVDPRLAVAVADPNFDVAEVLAGAPQLIRRYEQATADQKAVLWAAIDAYRLGVRSPLSEQLLCAAARGYLSVAHPDDTWLPDTLSELARRDRATAPLLEIHDAEHRTVIGYTVADYLLQRAIRQRRTQRIPATSWQALMNHTHDLSDLRRLAHSAEDRLLYCFAIPLNRRLADSGDNRAADHLTDLLAQQGQLEALRARAADDERAALHLADLLAEQGQLEELRARAEAGGDRFAADRLAKLLVEQGQLEELRVRAASDKQAADRLTKLLAEQSQLEELRARADAGDHTAAFRLVDLLAEQGQIEELRARADAGDVLASYPLADQLAEHGQIEELRVRADAGSPEASYRLADLLVKLGQLEELRGRANAGDRWAGARLVDLLAEQGQIEELRALADSSDPHQERAGHHLAGLLAEQGRLEELRARADAGSHYAAVRLAEVLAEQGQLEELRARADSHDSQHDRAAYHLASLLAQQGQLEELRARTAAGDYRAAHKLTDLLVEQCLAEDLRTEVDAGTPNAGAALGDLLIAQGQIEEGKRLKQFGLNPDGSIASEPVLVA